MLIKFSIHKHRKGSTSNKFNSGLSGYWRELYYGMFKNWE